MSLEWMQFPRPFEFDWPQQIDMMQWAAGRLLAAALLGGAVGLQREATHKSAGVRTNLLVAVGCAFFTLLSAVLAGDTNPDKGRVASNIVQGIGFLGAGLILHNRRRISGLTSAASVFVVASIGMACGAGLFAAATVAAALVILTLELVGFLERRANLKIFSLIYEARGRDHTLMLESILDAMDKAGERLGGIDSDAIGELQRVSFAFTATKTKHEQLRGKLEAEPAIDALFTFPDPEED